MKYDAVNTIFIMNFLPPSAKAGKWWRKRCCPTFSLYSYSKCCSCVIHTFVFLPAHTMIILLSLNLQWISDLLSLHLLSLFYCIPSRISKASMLQQRSKSCQLLHCSLHVSPSKGHFDTCSKFSCKPVVRLCGLSMQIEEKVKVNFTHCKSSLAHQSQHRHYKVYKHNPVITRLGPHGIHMHMLRIL